MNKNEDICVDYSDYDDLCPDCEKHGDCHKDNIDYDSVYICKKELWRVKREKKRSKDI